jgi:hypothetical protein
MQRVLITTSTHQIETLTLLLLDAFFGRSPLSPALQSEIGRDRGYVRDMIETLTCMRDKVLITEKLQSFSTGGFLTDALRWTRAWIGSGY